MFVNAKLKTLIKSFGAQAGLLLLLIFTDIFAINIKHSCISICPTDF